MDSRMVEKTRGKVRKFLQRSFGGAFKEQGDIFWGRQGTTVVMIRVLPWPSVEDAQVQVIAGIARDVDPTIECLSFLLKENQDFILGGFALEGDRDIIFRHGIIGSKMDQKELEASVLAVASTGDKFDDIITSRFGGVKISDLAEEATAS